MCFVFLVLGWLVNRFFRVFSSGCFFVVLVIWLWFFMGFGLVVVIMWKLLILMILWFLVSKWKEKVLCVFGLLKVKFMFSGLFLSRCGMFGIGMGMLCLNFLVFSVIWVLLWFICKVWIFRVIVVLLFFGIFRYCVLIRLLV